MTKKKKRQKFKEMNVMTGVDKRRGVLLLTQFAPIEAAKSASEIQL
jgi:hypothetical protein